MYIVFCLLLTCIHIVHPAHLAFVLLNEGGAAEPSPSGAPSHGGAPLFASVVTKAGGDPVGIPTLVLLFMLMKFTDGN